MAGRRTIRQAAACTPQLPWPRVVPGGSLSQRHEGNLAGAVDANRHAFTSPPTDVQIGIADRAEPRPTFSWPTTRAVYGPQTGQPHLTTMRMASQNQVYLARQGIVRHIWRMREEYLAVFPWQMAYRRLQIVTATVGIIYAPNPESRAVLLHHDRLIHQQSQPGLVVQCAPLLHRRRVQWFEVLRIPAMPMLMVAQAGVNAAGGLKLAEQGKIAGRSAVPMNNIPQNGHHMRPLRVNQAH